VTAAARLTAIVRPPADSFARALSQHPERDRIDPALARVQHAAYCRLLEAAGVHLVRLPPDGGHPDACFTQDTAVVLADRAILAHFGVASRQGEEEAVAPVLSGLVAALASPAEDATLEGGDVLVFGNRLAVGRSRRTNDAGIEALRSFAGPLGYTVEGVEIPAWALHLSTAATVLAGEVVLGAADVLAQPVFDGLDRVVVPDDQPAACNVWSPPPGAAPHHRFVIAAGSHPVHRELERRGFDVHATDLSEFNRADGSPTCLSLVVAAGGGHRSGA
jgi:dimethylargininase